MTPIEVVSPIRHQEFPNEWYEASDASHFWFRWRLAALKQALDEAGAATDRPLLALDIGCGSGVLAAQLENATAWNVDGTDLNMQALERCRARRGRTLYYDVTDERPEMLGRYDVAVLFDILEHLPEPRAIVRSALRHLKAGGTLLVNVPALPLLMSAYDRAAGHLRRYTTRSLETEIGVRGLTTKVLRYWGLSLVPLLVARKAILAGGGPNTIHRGFRPPHAIVNDALVALMRLETKLLHAPRWGTSVLYVGVKADG